MLPRVEPDGSRHAPFIIVGEAPAKEEVKEGRGFVGPSGRLLWPLLERLAGVTRDQCYVTNLCKHPLDNDLSGDAKLTEDEFRDCQKELWAEVDLLGPGSTWRSCLAVGKLAAKALLPEGVAGRPLEVINGMAYRVHGSLAVIPTFHPASALRPGGEDKLAYTGQAISRLRSPIAARGLPLPPPMVGSKYFEARAVVGVDTEGTPDDPICLTAASMTERTWVEPGDVSYFLSRLRGAGSTLIFHNALWDWRVIEAMGSPSPWNLPWKDTMEMAYLQQTEPRGLKELAFRHYGLEMKSFEEIAAPVWYENLQWAAEGRIQAGTTLETHTPKGKVRKVPKQVLSDEAKVVKRNLKNPKRLAELLRFPPMSLRFSEGEKVREYATLDAWVTLILALTRPWANPDWSL